jgi:hypothetical protein
MMSGEDEVILIAAVSLMAFAILAAHVFAS